jgi:hypothetical protein
VTWRWGDESALVVVDVVWVLRKEGRWGKAVLVVVVLDSEDGVEVEEEVVPAREMVFPLMGLDWEV